MINKFASFVDCVYITQVACFYPDRTHTYIRFYALNRLDLTILSNLIVNNISKYKDKVMQLFWRSTENRGNAHEISPTIQ